ncbi:H-NS family nucleoid-associated regulatory protein [Paraburkholderia tropica]|uniref:H-NS family nucleoid-associated regulatory protein n=1 Tax=Paraburkholderia tropica TaxID=92647 RepID=UPI002ABDE49B|nr:H-NS family nucleoid-associated regulatory protein [Paraburkholderia tropica]
MATLQGIQAKIAKLQAQAEVLATQKSTVVLDRIRALMDKHGITTADIEAHQGSKKRGPKSSKAVATNNAMAAAKYRDPKSGATWSGRGRAPAWIANAKNRDKFLAEPTSVAEPVAKRAGNYARGPQPAKYRDPETGATWSGKGRAPAWIADAKSREKFLIEA